MSYIPPPKKKKKNKTQKYTNTKWEWELQKKANGKIILNVVANSSLLNTQGNTDTCTISHKTLVMQRAQKMSCFMFKLHHGEILPFKHQKVLMRICSKSIPGPWLHRSIWVPRWLRTIIMSLTAARQLSIRRRKAHWERNAISLKLPEFLFPCF